MVNLTITIGLSDLKPAPHWAMTAENYEKKRHIFSFSFFEYLICNQWAVHHHLCSKCVETHSLLFV